jgi:uncharacterized protein (DUF4415 family)
MSPKTIDDLVIRAPAPPEQEVADQDNPEWTEKDFAQAKGPESLPPEVLAQFPKTRPRGRPRLERPKQSLSLRLKPEIIEVYKATGQGWQARMEAVLLAGAPKALVREGRVSEHVLERATGITVRGPERPTRAEGIAAAKGEIKQAYGPAFGPKRSRAGARLKKG